MLFSFQVTAPSVFQKPFRPLTLTIIVLLPMILFAFLYLRMDKTKQVLAEESLAEAKNAPRHRRELRALMLQSREARNGRFSWRKEG